MKKNTESAGKPQKTKNNGASGGKKKKGMSCCGCFAVFCLVFVLILGAGLGVGYYYANSYLKANFDLTFGETWGLVSELYKADRDKIVTNAPTEADEAGFYSAVESGLYLKDGTVDRNSFKAISDSLTGQEDGAADDGAPAENPETVLCNILNRENIDTATMKTKFVDGYDYALNYDADFLVSVTDKQLLTMVRSIVEDKITDGEAKTLLKCITAEQLDLSRNDADNPVVSMVVRADVKELIDAYVPSDSGIPDWVIGIIKGVLPKEIFITADVEIGEKFGGNVKINSMDGVKQENFYKLLSGILRLSGQGDDAHKFIDDMLSEYAGEMFSAADTYLDFHKNVGDGVLKLDMLGALASTAFNDMKGVELAEIYASVTTSDTDKMLENNAEHLFEDKYIVVDGDKVKEVYSPAAAIDGAKLIDYRAEFTRELTSKYLISTEYYLCGGEVYLMPVWQSEAGNKYELGKLVFEDGVSYTGADGQPRRTLYVSLEDGASAYLFEQDAQNHGDYEKIELAEKSALEFDDIAALLGIGKSEKVKDYDLSMFFDPRRLSEKIGGEQTNDKTEWFVNRPDSELEFVINEKMLAALVQTQMKTLSEEGGTFNDGIHVKFTALSVGEEETVAIAPENPDGDPTEITVRRKFLTLGCVMDSDVVFGDIQLLKGLFGSTLAFSVKIDITPELDEAYLLKPETVFSDLSKARSDSLLEKLTKTGVNDFTAETLASRLAKPVRDAIIKMDDSLGGVKLGIAEMDLPNVFGLLSKQMFAPDPEKTFGGNVIQLSGTDIHKVLQGVYNLPDVKEESGATYLTNENGTYENVYGNNRDNDITLTAAANGWCDSHGGDSDMPLYSDDLGELVGFYDGGNSEDVMYITFKYNIKHRVGSTSADSNLITVDCVYATFAVDKTNSITGGGYKTELTVNDMSPEDRTLLEMTMTYFDGNMEGEFGRMEEQIGRFASYLDNVFLPLYRASAHI